MAAKVVVDTSAIVAILLEESNWEKLYASLVDAEQSLIGNATLVEAAMVLASRYGESTVIRIEQLLDVTQTRACDFDDLAFEEAFSLFLRFGKGRHPARLNLGDCLCGGFARAQNADLLFVGDDFEKAGFPRLV